MGLEINMKKDPGKATRFEIKGFVDRDEEWSEQWKWLDEIIHRVGDYSGK